MKPAPFALALLLCGSAAPAFAQPMPTCRVPEGVHPIAVLRGVPAAVMAAFRREVPLFAMPGQPFEAGDAIGPDSPRFGRRLDFVWRRGDRWAFAWEQGGIAHFGTVSLYTTSGVRLGSRQAQPNQQMCAAADRLLRNERPTVGPAPGPGGPGKGKP